MAGGVATPDIHAHTLRKKNEQVACRKCQQPFANHKQIPKHKCKPCPEEQIEIEEATVTVETTPHQEAENLRVEPTQDSEATLTTSDDPMIQIDIEETTVTVETTPHQEAENLRVKPTQDSEATLTTSDDPMIQKTCLVEGL
ncbi:unnamed protein product [Owenia fusiformis]|uniref:Uncharacterized protein n=1 Tax=Owenia fusiformis TaxID=6347 RepID=A0A8J1Y8S0_OWEFU|nr:unnamed protein product [Owenia fusiformis]